MALRVRGTAPGKLLLVGEHGVVHGGTAFAVPFDAVFAQAEIWPEPGPIYLQSDCWSGQVSPDAQGPCQGLCQTILETLRKLAVEAENYRIQIASTIPTGAGLGSSAATAAAVVKTIYALHGANATDDLEALVGIAEKFAHGNPSGVDGRVIALERPIAFTRGSLTSPVVPTGARFHLVVANTGVPRDTRRAVAVVQRQLETHPASARQAIESMGTYADSAIMAWKLGDSATLGQCLTHAHEVLRSLEVSTPKLDQLVEVAMRAGALGAKMTGAGMGGCMLALAKNPEDAAAIAEALHQHGALQTWIQTYDIDAASSLTPADADPPQLGEGSLFQTQTPDNCDINASLPPGEVRRKPGEGNRGTKV